MKVIMNEQIHAFTSRFWSLGLPEKLSAKESSVGIFHALQREMIMTEKRLPSAVTFLVLHEVLTCKEW